MSVPQFGSWENQGGGGGGPNPADGYTMVFTKARADRKEQKAKTVPSNIAINPDENDAQHHSKPRYNHRHHHGHRQGHRNHHHRDQEQRRHSHQSSQNVAAVKITHKKSIQ